MRAAATVQGRGYGEEGYAPVPRRRPAPASLPDLVARHRPTRRLPWGYTELTLPPTARVQLHGPPGGGKSTIALIAGMSLGAQGVPVIVLSAEEGQGETVVSRVIRCADLLGLRGLPACVEVADVESATEALADLEAWRIRTRGDGVVILDSTTVLRVSADWIRQALVDEHLGAILVEHQTTTGAPRGGWETAYEVQVVVRCEGLQAQSMKSRWGALARWSILAPMQIEAEVPHGQLVQFPKTVMGRK